MVWLLKRLVPLKTKQALSTVTIEKMPAGLHSSQVKGYRCVNSFKRLFFFFFCFKTRAPGYAAHTGLPK
jgi:hypothetical protein